MPLPQALDEKSPGAFHFREYQTAASGTRFKPAPPLSQGAYLAGGSLILVREKTVEQILSFVAHIAAIAVCLSITVVAIAYPFVKAFRIIRGH